MFVLQESCKLKFHLSRILQDEVYLQKNALSCKILQDILQDSYFFSTKVYAWNRSDWTMDCKELIDEQLIAIFQ